MAIEASAIQAWAAMATALGVGSLIPKALGLLKGAVTGRSTRDRAEIDRCRTECDRLRRSRDDEAAFRREWQEHASEVRALALGAGVRTGDLPRTPVRTNRTNNNGGHT